MVQGYLLLMSDNEVSESYPLSGPSLHYPLTKSQLREEQLDMIDLDT